MQSMVFENRPLTKRSLLQRLFRQEPEENAIIELNNLLASRKICAITDDDIKSIEDKYALNLRKEFRLNLEEFYLVYLNYRLKKDFLLSDSDRNDLRHLERILGLSTSDIWELVQKLGIEIYRAGFSTILRKQNFNAETILQNLVETLGLPLDLIVKERTRGFVHFTNNYVAKIVSRNRYSPDEEAFLVDLSRHVQLPLKFAKDVTLKLNEARRLWELQHLELTPVEVNARFQKKELCYFQSSNAQWYEYRSVRGVREPRLLYSGDIYLTNKRVLFQGLEKNTAIKLSAITGVFDHSNCLEIRKDTGRSPLIALADMEAFAIVISRLLNSDKKE